MSWSRQDELARRWRFRASRGEEGAAATVAPRGRLCETTSESRLWERQSRWTASGSAAPVAGVLPAPADANHHTLHPVTHNHTPAHHSGWSCSRHCRLPGSHHRRFWSRHRRLYAFFRSSDYCLFTLFTVPETTSVETRLQQFLPCTLFTIFTNNADKITKLMKCYFCFNFVLSGSKYVPQTMYVPMSYKAFRWAQRALRAPRSFATPVAWQAELTFIHNCWYQQFELLISTIRITDINN